MSWRDNLKLKGFTADQEQMIRVSGAALLREGYDPRLVAEIDLGDLPPRMRGMTWSNNVILVDQRAFSSQAMLNHVLEEELIHLMQKAEGLFNTVGPTTVDELEEEVNARRKFFLPES